MTATIDRTIWTRAVAVLVTALLALTLLPLTSARAQGVDLLEPGNPCVVDAPPAPYADRDKINEVHRLTVDCTFELEISQGRTRDGRRFYDPRGTTRRDMMATFIVQTLEAAGYRLPAPTDQGFDDIAGNTHKDNINRLAAAGIVNGKSRNRYAPGQAVRRDQMASFLLQATSFAYNDTEFEAVVDPGFVDVLPTNVHRDSIAASFDLFGLVQGRSDTMYNPAQATSRQQMATFLTRLIDITLKDNVVD